MGLRQTTFCDTCGKEIPGGSAPGNWIRVTYRQGSGETTEKLLCDDCFRALMDVFGQIAGGKKPDVARIPVLERELRAAKDKQSHSDSQIRNQSARIDGQIKEIGRLSTEMEQCHSNIRQLATERQNLFDEVKRLDGLLKKRGRAKASRKGG